MTQSPQGWPGGQPPAHWSPTPLGGNGGAPSPDPGRPLGPARAEAVNIEKFAPPRTKAPWIIGLAVLVAAMLIVVSANLPAGFFGPPAPAASPSPSPSPTRALPGHPFSSPYGSVEGRWEIRDHRWTDSGVQLELWVAVDEGTLSFSFVGFANNDADAEVLYPAPGADYPALTDSPVQAGEERSGWLFFPAPRTAMTVILATDEGRQISALVVDG